MKLWVVYRMDYGGEYQVSSLWDSEQAAKAEEIRLHLNGEMEVTYVSDDFTLNTPAWW